MKRAPIFFILVIILTGCYPMPQEGIYSQIPTTNNPDVVGDKGGSKWMPGAGF